MNDFNNWEGGQGANGALRQQMPLSKSVTAIIGLVLGVLALLTSLLPLVNNLSFAVALAGIILSVIGLVGILRNKKSGKVLAIVAIVINVLAIVFVLMSQSFYGAVLDEVSSEMSNPSSETSTTTTPDTSESATQAEEQASQYVVTIDDCLVTTDYSGAPAIVVTYTFTNNSDVATSFLIAISDKCFQNGVELDFAMVSEIDGQSSLNEIKPGATTTVQQAYLLDDQTEVSVECSELISWDDVILAEKTFTIS